jgi:hypothetical protein
VTVKRKQLPQNLLSETWVDLDSDELRLLLRERFNHSSGQYDGTDGKLYLPVAGAQSRIALSYDGTEIVAVEPGQAFDAAEWQRISQGVEDSILAGTSKTGRDYSFSSFPVDGSWRGRSSGVQILPAPNNAPRAPGAREPFILEFPIKGSDQWTITNHRRIREHRNLTLLLNVLLAGRTSCLSRRPQHLWANVPPYEGDHIKWVQEGYFAPLDHAVLDEPSTPAADRLQEIEPDEYYTTVRGRAGLGLRVPADLDESICRYFRLSPEDKAKFDRATFWLDMAARQWDISVSAAFAAYVSAIEALTERGDIHHFSCPECGGRTQHEVPGATQRFRDFIEAHASGEVLAGRRSEMYDLRSGILHGSKLIEVDYGLAFGWDPPWWNQRELIWDLSSVTRIALRNWLRSRSALMAS